MAHRPHSVIIRHAEESDLPAIAAVWYASEVKGESDPPPPPEPDLYRYQLETGDLQVADERGVVVGFACRIDRGEVSYLADLFVVERWQSAGVGRALLQAVFGDRARPRFTLASTDPRAVGLYVRTGLEPRWPHFILQGSMNGPRWFPGGAEGDRVEAIEAPPDDPALATMDAEIGGRHRLQDHHFWLSSRAAVPLLLRRRGRVIGYCLVQLRSPVVLRHPDAATIGPLGVRSPEDSASAVGAALRWAGPRREIVAISVPAANPALPTVLRAGLRIVYTETFLSTGAPFFDPARYIASGSELF